MSPLNSIRQRLANAGTDRRQLDIVRHALAGTEDAKQLRALASVASELSATADDGILDEVADLVDRIFEKAERIGCDLLPVRPSPVRCSTPSGGVAWVPMVKMVVGEWETDSNGVRSRKLWNAADGPVPPP
jgi:hypothetical protein